MPAKKQAKGKAQTLSLSEFQSTLGETSTTTTSWADHGDDDFMNSLPSSNTTSTVEKPKEEAAPTTSSFSNSNESGYSLSSIRAQKSTTRYERQPYDGPSYPRDDQDRSSGPFSRSSRPQRPKNDVCLVTFCEQFFLNEFVFSRSLLQKHHGLLMSPICHIQQ